MFRVYDMCAVCDRKDECKLVQYLTWEGCKDEKLDELLAEYGATVHFPITKCSEFELICSETWYYNDDWCHIANIELNAPIFPNETEVADVYVHKKNVGEIYVPYPWEKEIGGEIPIEDEDYFWEIFDEYKETFISALIELFVNKFDIDEIRLNYYEDKEGWGLVIESEELYWRLIEHAGVNNGL